MVDLPASAQASTARALADALWSAGLTVLQLRMKDASAAQMMAFLGELLASRPAGGRVVVNDRLDVALAGGADGVHLGQDDLPLAAARALRDRWAVPGFVIGISTHNEEQAAAAIDAYCEGYTRAYGTETPLNPKVAAARMELKSRLAAAEEKAAQSSVARPRPVEAVEASEPVGPAPMPAPMPAGKPWRPLVISGAVLTGVGGLALLAAVYGGVSGLGLTRDYDTTCAIDDPSTTCQDLLTKGKAANGLAVSGAVLGVLLVGAGVPLLVVGMKRKRHSRAQALQPLLAPGFVGLGLRGRF